MDNDSGLGGGPRRLGMSMFASLADYKNAVEKQEGYHPDDAFNDGQCTRLEGGRANPYNPESAPVCFAAWNRGRQGGAS